MSTTEELGQEESPEPSGAVEGANAQPEVKPSRKKAARKPKPKAEVQTDSESGLFGMSKDDLVAAVGRLCGKEAGDISAFNKPKAIAFLQERIAEGNFTEKDVLPMPRSKKKGENSVRKASSNGTRERYTEDMKIKVLAKENPRRPGTGRFNRFNKYRTGMTVGEVLKKIGGNRSGLRRDVEEGLIRVS